MTNTAQQNSFDDISVPKVLTVEGITAALFGAPIFTSSLGDPFESKAPDGSGGKWMGRRVAQARVPLLVNGIEAGITFLTTVYRDVSPDGESYAVRVSLPSGSSKWQSAFEGDNAILDALKYHIADHADRWLEQQAKTARPTATGQPAQPRLIVRKVAKPEAPAPVAAAPVTETTAPVTPEVPQAPAAETTPAQPEATKPTGNKPNGRK